MPASTRSPERPNVIFEVQRRGGVLSRVSKGREAARKALSRHASATRAAERGEVQVGNRWGDDGLPG